MSLFEYMYTVFRPEEGIRFPGTGVMNSCELLSECWILNLVPFKFTFSSTSKTTIKIKQNQIKTVLVLLGIY